LTTGQKPPPGNRHLSGGDECGDPGEQPDCDQQAEDQLEYTGVPIRPGAHRDSAAPRIDGPGKEFGCTVDGEQQTEHDAEQADDSRRN
jgi:hypothetical protein